MDNPNKPQQEKDKNSPRQWPRSKQRRAVPEINPAIYGKIPPQARDLEEAVLGACLQIPEAFEQTLDILHAPDAFYVEANKVIFSAIAELYSKKQPIDILTVREILTKWGKLEEVGGSFYLTQCTASVVSAAHIVKHSRIIMEKYLLREIIRIAGGLMSQGFQDAADPFEILEEAERDIFAVRAGSIKKEFRRLDRILVECLQEFEELRHRDKHLTGTPAGYKDLDYVTCGWQPTDLVILAARPSVGKTAFAIALARNAIRNDPDGAVGFFSLEMKDKKLVHRLLSSESGTWIWNLANARMDDVQMENLYKQGIQPLAQVNILIDDTTSLPVTEFRAKARRMVAKHGVKIIFVDYLQLMSAPEYINNREQQIAYISRELKATAKELNIPVIALAQMSRDVEKQKTREPQLSDLRESGAIEQDADIVIFLWKPFEADIVAQPELLNACYVGIKKHRNGALAKFVGIFQKEIQRWATVALIDDVTLKPIGDKWVASTKPPNLIDFTEAKRSDEELSGPPDPGNKGDLPF